MTATDRSREHDRDATNPADAPNQGVSTPEPAEGADDAPGGNDGSAEG